MLQEGSAGDQKEPGWRVEGPALARVEQPEMWMSPSPSTTWAPFCVSWLDCQFPWMQLCSFLSLLQTPLSGCLGVPLPALSPVDRRLQFFTGTGGLLLPGARSSRTSAPYPVLPRTPDGSAELGQVPSRRPLPCPSGHLEPKETFILAHLWGDRGNWSTFPRPGLCLCLGSGALSSAATTYPVALFVLTPSCLN